MTEMRDVVIRTASVDDIEALANITGPQSVLHERVRQGGGRTTRLRAAVANLRRTGLQ